MTDNRATRRHAFQSSEGLDVLIKLGKFLLTLLVLFGILFGGLMFWALQKTPSVVVKMKAQPQPLPVGDLTGEELAELIQLYDPDFYSHAGFSFHAPGLETITQRMVAQYYFDDYQAWLEMWPGTFHAWVLNRKMPKDEQLRVFINTIRLGNSRDHDVKGLQEAAHYFFDKKFQELNRDEYIAILAMIEDPQKYHIQAQALANIERSKRVKNFLDGKCKQAGIFDQELKNCN